MDTEEEKDDHETDTIGECPPREMAGTVGTVFEGLDEGSERVELHDGAQATFGYLAERIDDRRSVHPEGDEDAEEIDEVAVLGGKRRDDESQAQRDALQRQHDDREEAEVPVGMQVRSFDRKEDIDEDEGSELDGEAEEA